MYMKRLSLFIAILGLACTLLFAGKASATVSVSLRPVKYILDINPGTQYNDEIIVINGSDQAITLKADLQDFVPAGEASINVVPHAGPGTSLVDWINIDRGAITFAPNEEKRIPFSINIPQNAAPGSHLAVIYFDSTPDINGTGSSVGITTKVGSLVMVSVPGNISKAGSVDSFSGPITVENGPISFTIKYHNSGSVHYKPEGTIEIKNLLGQTVSQGTVDSQYVFANTSRTMNGTVASAQYYWGPNKAVLHIKDGEGKEQVVTYQFWGLPWRVTVLPLIGVILLIIGIVYLKKKVKISFK